MPKCVSPHGESPDPSRFVLEGVDDLSSRVFLAFLVTLRLHKQLMHRTLAGQGTHPGQIFCLHVLAGHDGLSQRDLADALAPVAADGEQDAAGDGEGGRRGAAA